MVFQGFSEGLFRVIKGFLKGFVEGFVGVV